MPPPPSTNTGSSGRRGFGGFVAQAPPVQILDIPPPRVVTPPVHSVGTIPTPPPPVSPSGSHCFFLCFEMFTHGHSFMGPLQF